MSFRLSTAALTVLLLLAGCSRNPQVACRRYIASGQRYFDKGQYADASIQFRKALQVDPRSAEALYCLGRTELKLKREPADNDAPEPAILVLFGCGLLLVGVAIRRRRVR